MRTIAEIRTAIEAAANHTTDEAICVRWCALGDGWWVWINAEDVADAGSLSEWLEECAGLEEDELEFINNQDWEVVDDDGGLVGEFCDYSNGWGYFDCDEYITALEALEESGMELEAFKAGLSLGIPADKVWDAYRGDFDSDEDFAEDLWENCGYLSEMPEFARNYIDWQAVARDLMFDFQEEDGHYFDRNW